MGKTSKKDLQAKKRAKRRELLNASTYPWERIDVSAWFDNKILMDQPDTDELIFDNCPGTNGIYTELAPAEANLTYWANTHPEQEIEAHAARLAASILREEAKCCAPDAAEEQTAAYKDFLKSSLKELAALAEEGVVTACTVLGSWYYEDGPIRKNKTKAQKYLLSAAEAGDPYACFLLAGSQYFPERTEEFHTKSLNGRCPSAFVARAMQILQDNKILPTAEFETLALYLAAFASHNCWHPLYALLGLLRMEHGKSLREEYSTPMLKILESMAQAGIADAMTTQAVILSEGSLCGRDAKKAKEVLLQAMEKGSKSAKCFYASLLYSTAQELPPAEKKQQIEKMRTLLKENCQEMAELGASYSLLGASLVSSDDDAEFMEGISCLNKSLSYKEPICAQSATAKILFSQTDPKRRAQAFRLLDKLAGKKDADALHLKGLFLLAEKADAERKDEGLKMVQQAAEQGCAKSWSILTAIHLFGLFSQRPDVKKALSFASEGEKHGDEVSRFWRVIIELGEFSRPAVAYAGDVSQDLSRKRAALNAMLSVLPVKSPLAAIMDALFCLEAANSCRHIYGAQFPPLTPAMTAPARIADSASLFAAKCVDAMRTWDVDVVAFSAYALKQFKPTQFYPFYASAMLSALQKPADTSPDNAAGCLTEFLDNLPQSHLAHLQRTGAEQKPGSQKHPN